MAFGDWDFTADYSLGSSGSSLSGFNTSGWDFGSGNTYDLGSSRGGFDGFNTSGWNPNSGGTYSLGSSSGGFDGFNTSSWDAGSGGAWWTPPTSTSGQGSFDGYGFSTGQSSPYALGVGAGSGAGAFGAMSGAGAFAPQAAPSAVAAPSSSSITGAQGVDPSNGGSLTGGRSLLGGALNGEDTWANIQDPAADAAAGNQGAPTGSQYSLLGSGLRATGAAPTTATQTNAAQPSKDDSGVFGSLRKFGRENEDLARLGIGIFGAVTAHQNSSRANDAMRAQTAARERENAMKLDLYNMQMEQMRRMQEQGEEAQASQFEALRRNNMQADYWNQQAQQSADEARSLYNPQELAVRGYAQEQGATQRNIAEQTQSMQRRGLSRATIDAENRRAKLGGSTGATTAFIKGLDTGRAGQQSALGAASSLARNYGGVSPAALPNVSVPSYGSNLDTATYYNSQAAAESNELQKLLNYYLGDPLGKTAENNLKKEATV